MNTLRLQHEDGRAVTVSVGGQLLCRYVYAPGTARTESPLLYFHPINSLAGDTLTNFRPNDHPWHHGLSFTLTNVSGRNFWGGPTCRREDGYKLRDDHGEQRHVAWAKCEAAGATATLAHTLEWHTPKELTFREDRVVTITADAAGKAWSLRWATHLVNTSGRALALDNPHSFGGLPGSHYTGLQFRGARALLDDHGDPTIRIVAEGGLEGEKTVHGAAARWICTGTDSSTETFTGSRCGSRTTPGPCAGLSAAAIPSRRSRCRPTRAWRSRPAPRSTSITPSPTFTAA